MTRSELQILSTMKGSEFFQRYCKKLFHNEMTKDQFAAVFEVWNGLRSGITTVDEALGHTQEPLL